MRTCCVFDCNKPVVCKLRCNRHYVLYKKMSPEEKANAGLIPSSPKWEYENPTGETELAARSARMENGQ